VPHTLSISQKSEKVSHPKLLLIALMKQNTNGFRQMITGAESRFLFDYSRDSVWAALDDELPQRIAQ
jgi:hypothetical protein